MLITKRCIKLSPKTYVGNIEIRVFSHATEDVDKVLISAKNLFPVEIKENLTFKKTQLTGYYKNPIILYKIQLNDKILCLETLKFISDQLNLSDKQNLTINIKNHLDKKNLYLRFDKQLAFVSILKFSTNDPIHLKIHFETRTTREIIDLVKELGLIL